MNETLWVPQGNPWKANDMKVINLNRPNPPKLQLPRNLAEWTTEKGLLALALDSTQSINWQAKDIIHPFPRPLRPQMLLTLFTYCYSVGIYSTHDILEAIQNNRTVRYICAYNYPDEALLRKFRRSFRSQIEQALRWVMLQAWALRLDNAETDYLGYDWFLNHINSELDATVQSRLELAILLDGVEND